MVDKYPGHHSRYIVGCEIYDHVPTADDIVDLMERAIDSYAMPLQVLTDHGTQFYPTGRA
jgi:transposase InsO family protein